MLNKEAVKELSAYLSGTGTSEFVSCDFSNEGSYPVGYRINGKDFGTSVNIILKDDNIFELCIKDEYSDCILESMSFYVDSCVLVVKDLIDNLLKIRVRVTPDYENYLAIPFEE